MGRATYQAVAARPKTSPRLLGAGRRVVADRANGSSAGVPIFLKRVASTSEERLPRFLQPKLRVSDPDSPLETEADRAADQVADGLPQAQAGPASLMHDGTPVGARRDSASISGTLPRGVQRSMESRFGADLSGVRVHHDAGADAAARVMNARAFTVGEEIAFASGEYQPETPAGQRLLAHELAHVVQQSGGSHAGEHPSKLHGAPASIQRAIRTMGGEWDTTKYEAMKNAAGTTSIGVAIDLVFKPEDPVDAELIGMVQTARSVHRGKAVFPAGTEARAIPAGEEGLPEGTKIDQAKENANPLYAAGPAVAGDTLASTAPQNTAVFGDHGYHYTDASGSPQHKDPILKDKTEMDPPGNNASQSFETTALAVKGAQEGTYYGSVRWGWHTDASGTFTLVPLALGSTGIPSATFMRAAELWNDSTTTTGVASLDLPRASVTSGELPKSRGTSDLVIAIAKVNAELAALPPGTDKTNKEFEKKALQFELAKRADQPTIPLADQEKAAALLSTPDLIKRADALRTEVPGAAAGTAARTDKELEREAVTHEIAKRKILITVHVHETEDVIGSDSVYVTAFSMIFRTSTSMVDLNNGEEHTFVVPLSALFPPPPLALSAASVFIRAYDSDWEGDDLMFDKDWMWTDFPASDTQSRDGGKYTVTVDFAQLR